MRGEEDTYKSYAEQFADKHQMGFEDHTNQWDVVKEEMEEMEEAYLMFANGAIPLASGKEELAEEMADVVFTVFLMAEILDIDLRDEFIWKSEKNLRKSTERDENGKVTDDA